MRLPAYPFLLCAETAALAENPVCDNTEECGHVYETGCCSFGDEFVFVSKN